MILTKVSAGHFTGTSGKTAHIALQSRDTSVTTKILSVVYGTTPITPSGANSFDLKVSKGEAALTVVYAATDEEVVDLVETDGANTQKLMVDVFNPKQPFTSIWIEGV